MHDVLVRLPYPRCLLFATLVALCIGCAGDGSAEETDTAVPGPSGSPGVASTATLGLPQSTPEPTVPPAIEALLAPGPTYTPPVRVFFRNGDDLWQLTSDAGTGAVTNSTRLGPFASAPDGSRVAVVVYSRESGDELHEVRIVGGAGETQAVTLDARPAEPAIVALAWSWDGAWLAIAWDDGTLALVPAGPAVGPVVRFGDAHPGQVAARLEWSPNNAGLIWLSQGEAGRTLFVTPQVGESIVLGNETAAPPQPVRSFAWLPGRGRIAYVEGSATPTGAPSSIYTTLPDGSSRELLVSAGQFGPVAFFDDLSASPDGRRLAFSIFMPGADGAPEYRSLWVLNIDSGELEEVTTPAGYRVTDLWWVNIGLVWRGVDLAAGVEGNPAEYDGDTPFVLGLYSFDTRTSAIVFQSSRDD